MNVLTLPRKERERLARRTAILLAAEEVIAEKGFANATLEEIALRAEFGKGTLYNYFPDGKNQILFAIFERLFDRMVDIVGHSFSGLSPFRNELATFLANVFGFFSQRSDLFVILMREVQRAALMEDESTQQFFHEHGSRTVVALAEHVQAAIDRDELTDAPDLGGAHALAHHIIHTAKGFYMSQRCAFMSSHETTEPSSRELAGRVAALLTDGISRPTNS